MVCVACTGRSRRKMVLKSLPLTEMTELDIPLLHTRAVCYRLPTTPQKLAGVLVSFDLYMDAQAKLRVVFGDSEIESFGLQAPVIVSPPRSESGLTEGAPSESLRGPPLIQTW